MLYFHYYLCYTFINELYSSNDLQNNTEEILMSFCPKDFHYRVKCSETYSFLSPELLMVLLQFSVVNMGQKTVIFLSFNFFFSLKSLQPNEVSALKIQT